MKAYILAIGFTILFQSAAFASSTANQDYLIWQGHRIGNAPIADDRFWFTNVKDVKSQRRLLGTTFVDGDIYEGLEEVAPVKYDESMKSLSITTCNYGTFFKTKCYLLSKNRKDSYGIASMKYVTPIAVLGDPEDGDDDSDDNVDESSPKKARSTFRSVFDIFPNASWPLSANQLSKLSDIDESNFEKFYLGQPYSDEAVPFIGYDIGFSPISKTIGGRHVLDILQKDAGHQLGESCGNEDDSVTQEMKCTFILRGGVKGRPAILRCDVSMIDKETSFPSSCRIIAFQAEQEWFVLSVMGPNRPPEEGGGESISCSFETDETPDEITKRIVDAVSNSRIGIKLKIRDKDGSTGANVISLFGRNDAVPSKFYDKMYENSTLSVTLIFNALRGNHHYVDVDYTYVMLISADQSLDHSRYGDISTGDDNHSWFKKQILDVLVRQAGVGDKHCVGNEI